MGEISKKLSPTNFTSGQATNTARKIAAGSMSTSAKPPALMLRRGGRTRWGRMAPPGGATVVAAAAGAVLVRVGIGLLDDRLDLRLRIREEGGVVGAGLHRLLQQRNEHGVDDLLPLRRRRAGERLRGVERFEQRLVMLVALAHLRLEGRDASRESERRVERELVVLVREADELLRLVL